MSDEALLDAVREVARRHLGWEGELDLDTPLDFVRAQAVKLPPPHGGAFFLLWRIKGGGGAESS